MGDAALWTAYASANTPTCSLVLVTVMPICGGETVVRSKGSERQGWRGKGEQKRRRTFSSTEATSTPAEMRMYDRENETMEREMLVMRYALP